MNRADGQAGPGPAVVAAALHRAGVAEVDASTRRRAEYSSDASLYRVVPQVVVAPRHVDEVATVLAVCHDLEVPLTARGAGTSVAGNAVGTGVVLDTSRHLTGLGEVDPERRRIAVEPGVVLDDVQRRASPAGLRFGPDPSTHDRCTIGGMIGNNACGSRALGYGRTSDNVESLEVLTGRGERLTVDADTLATSTSTSVAAVRRLVADRLPAVRDELGRFSRQVSGYSLEHLLADRGGHLARALVGTEGTCVLVLGATLRLVPRPARRLLVVLGYADMPAAADAVPALLPHGAVAMEGLDARIVAAVRAKRGDDAVPPLPRGDGWLFVELTGDAGDDLRARADALVGDAAALDHRVVDDADDARRLWRIREEGAGSSSRSAAGRPAHAGWEDAAVPPAHLGAYLRGFEDLLAQEGLTAMPYGHFGDGCVHARVDVALDAPDGRVRFRRFLEAAADLVAAHGGSMSGEHGDGRARSELLPRMYSDAALATFAGFAAAFDPHDRLNPGVIVRPRPADADLRAVALPRLIDGVGFTHPHDGGDLAAAVHRCIGVGRCIADTTADGGVMCPSYLATGDEKDSTRGRARVLQELVRGELVTDGWRAPEVAESLDLCLGCKGCASDCPAGVDVATYKAEVLHRAHRGRLRPVTHYSLGWLPRWAAVAARAPRLVNAALAAPGLGRLARRAAGIDPRRGLPRFARHSFRVAARARPRPVRPRPARRGGGASRQRVVLWVDTFTDRFAPEVAVAAVRVLEDAGCDVELAAPDTCCALTWISTGQLDAARRRLRRTVDALAPAARAGAVIVGLEPSCTAVLRRDARELLGEHDPAARDVAAATRTVAEVLAARRPAWHPPRLDDVTVVAQPHCHHHAVLGWETDRALLRAAGATVTAVGGCCGLAGNWGLERGHHEVSVAVAGTALLPAVRAAPPDAVVLADGFSCRTQLAELADRPSQHLVELLASRLT
jgi:FAD/FMN-containing dehydrogenase/Fe-S oxidoreductase